MTSNSVADTWCAEHPLKWQSGMGYEALLDEISEDVAAFGRSEEDRLFLEKLDQIMFTAAAPRDTYVIRIETPTNIVLKTEIRKTGWIPSRGHSGVIGKGKKHGIQRRRKR